MPISNSGTGEVTNSSAPAWRVTVFVDHITNAPLNSWISWTSNFVVTGTMPPGAFPHIRDNPAMKPSQNASIMTGAGMRNLPPDTYVKFTIHFHPQDDCRLWGLSEGVMNAGIGDSINTLILSAGKRFTGIVDTDNIFPGESFVSASCVFPVPTGTFDLGFRYLIGSPLLLHPSGITFSAATEDDYYEFLTKGIDYV